MAKHRYLSGDWRPLFLLPSKETQGPLTAREIRRYTGPLRVVAAVAFEADRVRVSATNFLNKMVNSLPKNNSVGAEKIQSVWNKAAARRHSPQADKLTKAAINDCREILRKDILPGLRACLSYQHDLITSETNNKVWGALKAGS
jgi:hypothetical protein